MESPASIMKTLSDERRFTDIFIAIPENNANKTVRQNAKDKEDIGRRADAGFCVLMGWLIAVFFGIAIGRAGEKNILRWN